MIKYNNHTYLVVDGCLAYPSKFHANCGNHVLAPDIQMTKWGFWLPYSRGSMYIESIMNNLVYTMDTHDIVGLMIGENGDVIHVEIAGSLLLLSATRLNHDFDVRTNVTGVPETFMAINHIYPKASAPDVFAMVSDTVPIDVRNLLEFDLSELYKSISDSPKRTSDLRGFVQAVRNFHAELMVQNEQYVQKTKIVDHATN